MNELQIAIFTALIGIFVGGFFYVSRLFSPKTNNADKVDENVKPANGKSNSGNNVEAKPTKKADRSGKFNKEKAFTHPWLLTSLKGHGGRVLSIDLSGNGKFLASSSEDRSLILWPTKNFAKKSAAGTDSNKIVRGNVTYDFGARIKWSPDSKAIILHKPVSRTIEIYKVSRKENSDAFTLQPSFEFELVHDASDDVVGLDMDSNGRYIMTCSSNKNDLAICDLRGSLLARLDTFRMTTSFANVSPCGQYVAAGGFTPDVKVWSVKFSKSKDFEKVQRAFELTGHTSGVYHFAWRNDSARVATISKDGTWRVFNVDVDHQMGQEPKLVNVGTFDSVPTSRVALSPDGRVLAVSRVKNVAIFSVDTGEKSVEFVDVHVEPITGLLFDAEGRFLITSGDKHVRVFHNVVGFKLALKDLEQKLMAADTKGLTERLTQQIAELKSRLDDIAQSKQ